MPLGDDPKPEIGRERIKIPIAAQQREPALDAAGRHQSVDRLPNGDAVSPQDAIVLGGLDRDFAPADLDQQQCTKEPLCCLKVPFAVEALQDFRQDQITDRQRFAAKEVVQLVCLRRAYAPEIVHPDTGIDQDQASVLISSRSARQANLPRHFRISS